MLVVVVAVLIHLAAHNLAALAVLAVVEMVVQHHSQEFLEQLTEAVAVVDKAEAAAVVQAAVVLAVQA
jgi:hypothetical protein